MLGRDIVGAFWHGDEVALFIARRRRAVRHRDREREAGLDRGKGIQLALGDDEGVVAALKRRIVEDIGVEEGLARVLALPEPLLAHGPIFGVHLAPAFDVREHEDVAGRIRPGLAIRPAPGGVDPHT